MRGFLTVLMALGFLGMQGATSAALAQDNSRLYQSLNVLNQTKPLQNPKYTESEDVLKNRLLDNGNRVVGTVKDVLLNGNGGVDALHVEFDRLHLRQDVFLNYNEMRIGTASGGYVLNIDDNQIEELFPVLLNNIDSAAGGEDIFSTQKIKGAKIRTSEGKSFGTVEDILFTNGGSRAMTLFVDMNYKSSRGAELAIPFNVVDLSSNGRFIELTIDTDKADTIYEFSKGKN